MTQTDNQPTREQIILAHQRDVWRFVVALGCSPVEADDIVQDTFIRVLEGKFHYLGEKQTRSYLFSVAKGLFISSIRRRGRSALVANLDDADVDWLRFQDECRVDDRVDYMRECLQSVGGRSHKALMMRYRDKADLAAIALELETGEEGAKSLLRRVRQRLRECVERRIARHEQH